MYEIYENGKLINTIVGNKAFVALWCENNGYTYKEVEQPKTDPEPTELEKLRADIDYLSIMTGVEL